MTKNGYLFERQLFAKCMTIFGSQQFTIFIKVSSAVYISNLPAVGMTSKQTTEAKAICFTITILTKSHASVMHRMHERGVTTATMHTQTCESKLLYTTSYSCY